jgi:hypothetical protein
MDRSFIYGNMETFYSITISLQRLENMMSDILWKEMNKWLK